MHLCAVHLRNRKLTESIIDLVCNEYTKNASSELFEEYLVVSCFVKTIKQKEKNRIIGDISIEKHIPSTNMEENTKRQGTVLSKMTGYSMIPGTKVAIKEKEDKKKSPYNPVVRSNSATSITPQQQGVKRFFYDLLGLDDEVSAGKISDKSVQVDKDTDSYLAEKAFVDSLAIQLLSSHPKERASCNIIADIYGKLRQNEANKLFKMIMERESTKTFELLEHFYSALEELQFPVPENFHKEFCRVGFKHLPRNVFLQYMERGVFQLDPIFVDQLVTLLSGPESDDLQFKFHMITKIPSFPLRMVQTSPMMDILVKNQRDFGHALSEYAISTIHHVKVKDIFTRESGSALDLEVGDDSPFIPFTVFLNSIRNEYSRNQLLDWNFIRQNEERVYSSLFGVSFDDVGGPLLGMGSPQIQYIPHISPASSKSKGNTPLTSPNPLVKGLLSSPIGKSKYNG
eukprot:TRINITY_DN5482_c4_g1_i2.p1 TRINITY_DN5482_c4_g1~~TRINITY_DN5482_c4_g1_i2.p1  ORF type:complete len:456 (+),score=137.21 TRINITY_DN5482_c4_g1_i2:230-1597(+)